jgi:outer membrane protein
LRRAGYTAEQKKMLLIDMQQTTLVNVAQAYYAVLTNEGSVNVLINSVELQNERVRDMEARLRAGVAKPLDVAQSEAQAAMTRVQLIQAQNNVRTGRIALAFLTGAPVQDARLENRVWVPEKLLTQDEAVKAAQKSRQDLRAAEAAVEAGRQSVQAAIGQYYPSVTLNLEYWLHKEATANLWTGMFQYNIPIFIGSIHANVRTAWSQLRQAWLNAERVRRAVSEQVRTSYENLEGSRLRILDLEIEVVAAQDALDQAQSSYKAGLATNLDVLTAIDALNTSKLGLITEQLNFKLVYLQLLRSEGVLKRPDSPIPPASQPTSRPSVDELIWKHKHGGRGAGMGSATAPTTRPATAPAQ